MPESKKHEEAAKLIARQAGTTYNRGKGADVIGSNRVVEVETKSTVSDGPRQLQGYRRPVYIAGADQRATEMALERTKGTTIGVMNPQGKIVRSSSRGRK